MSKVLHKESRYAKAVTGVAEEEINSDTIVAEEFRKVYSNTLRRTGKWTIDVFNYLRAND